MLLEQIERRLEGKKKHVILAVDLLKRYGEQRATLFVGKVMAIQLNDELTAKIEALAQKYALRSKKDAVQLCIMAGLDVLLRDA